MAHAQFAPEAMPGAIAVSYPPPGDAVIDQTFAIRPETANCAAEGRYGIENAPPWTYFDAADGSLTGTPHINDVGTYPDVRIVINDVGGRIELASFSITVLANQGTRALRLTWDPPTLNADGSALVNLAGYRIYEGTSPAALDNIVTLDNPGMTAYVLDSLAPGRHYLGMTAINSERVESDLSYVSVVALQ